MARITQDDFSGQLDAKDNNIVEIDATAHETITVPNADFISQSDISRDGQDLVLESPQGQTIVVQNYFAMDDAPLIEAPDGSILTSNLVNSFLNSSPEYAQVGSLNDVSPIGAVEEITGEATVIRVDGSTETLSLGSPIYKGDTIETNGDGAVNISFIDETSMAVSENARLSVDEYQFDPTTESGETNLSVLRGVFVFTSGLIGRDDPDDVNIDTPVGSIGIRGTVIAGNINPGGESKITVVEGAIVVTNGVSETTLSQQYESVRLGGFNENMQDIGVQDAETVGKTYGSVRDVLPKLFSSINDNIKQKENSANNKEKSNQQDEDVLDASEEVVEEEIIEDQEAQPEQDTNDLLELNIFDKLPVDKSILMRQTELLKEKNKNFDNLKNNLFKRFDDFQVNPEILEKPLQVEGEFRIIEGKNQGDVVAKFIAFEGSQGPVSFTFDNGLTTSADNHFEIVQIDGRQVVVRLTAAGESNLNGTTVGSVIGTPFSIIATDSNGNQQVRTFDPVVQDAAIHLNSAGGITDFLVRDGINLGPEKIGDFNGDKLEDTIDITASNINILSGINGGTLFGATAPNLSNGNIAGVGDINNDGFDDFIYGDPEFDTVGDADEGILKLVLGTDGTPAATSSNILIGSNIDYRVGTAVAGIGDFDGDGKSDYAFSAPGDSSTGTEHGAVHFELSAGATGLITGHSTGMKLGNNIAGLGDINGDGYSDVMFSATNQVSTNYEAYIFHGQTSALTGNASAAETTISTPHEIVSGGTAGDMNGDGFDDIAISLYDSANQQVNTFIIFGSNGLPTTIDMAYLENPDHAIKIKHNNINAGDEYNVVDLGDINGDGFDDIQLGVVGGDQYIVHGKASDDVIFDNKDNTTAGTGDGDSNLGKIQATDSNQSLVGDAHFIDNAYTGLSMRGGDGRNDFSLQNTSFRKIDGGAGFEDTIRYGNNGGTLDFSNVNFEQIEQVERIHFSQNGSTIKLTAENIFNLLKTSDNGSLTIELGSSNGSPATNGYLDIDMINTVTGTNLEDKIVNALNEQGTGATYNNINSDGNHHFEIGGYDLYIDADLNTQVV